MPFAVLCDSGYFLFAVVPALAVVDFSCLFFVDVMIGVAVADVTYLVVVSMIGGPHKPQLFMHCEAN